MFTEIFQPMHLLVILVVALLVFGPKKLPELGKGLGEALEDFRKGPRGGPGGGHHPIPVTGPIETSRSTPDKDCSENTEKPAELVR